MSILIAINRPWVEFFLDPHTAPSFDSGFLNNKADIAPLRWGYKKTREIARRMDGTSDH